MIDEFRVRLVQHANAVQDRLPYATSEAATRQYLILPFLQVLGYNPLDPTEVKPEVEASFSDKFKNRVDFVILKDGVPVIAIETKSAGSIKDAQRGEIRGYFNAVSSVKLGILTDGIVYEFFTDTRRENMMDELPFLCLNLIEIAAGPLDDGVIDAVAGIRKAVFDPAGVGADAKRKMTLASYTVALQSLMASPTDDFVKLLMETARVEGKRTVRLLQEHAPIVAEAIQRFKDQVILERVGFAERDDIVKKDDPSAVTTQVSDTKECGAETNGIITTENEISMFNFAVRRLAFLVKDSDLFGKLADVQRADHKTVFCVFYKQERKGRLFNYREGADPRHRFEFTGIGTSVECNDLQAIDEDLLKSFKARVGELG